MSEDNTNQAAQIAVLVEQVRQLADSFSALRVEMARDLDRLSARVENLTDQANRWRGAFWLLLGIGSAAPLVDAIRSLLNRV